MKKKLPNDLWLKIANLKILLGNALLLLIGLSVLYATQQLSNRPQTTQTQAATLPITVSIDATADIHPISKYIYGTAANGDPYQKVMGTTVSRWGGNQVTRYNWETEDSNSGADWGLCFQSYLNRNYGAFSNVDYGPSTNSGFSIRDSVTANRAMGIDQLFTVPMLGWVAKDGNNNTCSNNVPSSDGAPVGAISNDEAAISGYDPASNRTATSTRSQMKKGAAFVYPPNKTDNVVYQDELINWVSSQTGKANAGGIKFYAFDNEFDLWSSSHRDIHPAKAGYDALWSKYQTFANAVKDVDPSALTTGPVHWGWIQYWNSQLGSSDRSAHSNLPLDQWFLRQAKQAETQTGRRILDVLDVHYYPQSGEYGDDVSTNMAALRLRSPRELWDPTYTTESWQSCCEGGPQLQVIRRLKQWINTEYPGTKLGFTEWNWGADSNINGALAIADVLGIFGREDVYLANYWTSPEDQSPGYWAWRMYRNIDGNFDAFGDTSVRATVPTNNLDQISTYASKDASGKLKIMLINKMPTDNANVTLNITNYNVMPTAQVYQYAKTDPSKINKLTNITTASGNFSYTVTPYSITMLIFDSLGGTTPTTTPTSTNSPTPSLTPTKTPTPSPSPTATPSNSATPSPSTTNVPGDIDSSGHVNILDYTLLFEAYGRRTGDAGFDIRTDLTHDGVTNILDYTILFENFGR